MQLSPPCRVLVHCTLSTLGNSSSCKILSQFPSCTAITLQARNSSKNRSNTYLTSSSTSPDTTTAGVTLRMEARGYAKSVWISWRARHGTHAGGREPYARTCHAAKKRCVAGKGAWTFREVATLAKLRRRHADFSGEHDADVTDSRYCSLMKRL